MESRHGNHRGAGAKLKSSELPHDYITMVTDVFRNHFDADLAALRKLGHKPDFAVAGAVFPNEVILSVSLLNEGQLAATTVHTSVDFDPKASSPTAQDLLAACVDAAGGVLQPLLATREPQRLEAVAAGTLAELGEEIPYEWTVVEVERFRVHVKIDKANPQLDAMADDWLKKHDPLAQVAEAAEHQETEERFFTGPKTPEMMERLKRSAERREDRPAAARDEDSDDGDDEGGGPRTLH
jgi:hypothetical protein